MEGWKLFLKRVEMQIFVRCQERPKKGAAWSKGERGGDYRVRVSGGGGRDQMEGLALNRGDSYPETGEEEKRIELGFPVFRCWGGSLGSSNQMALTFSESRK